MSQIDDLLGELRSEGQVVASGGFTLDRDKAREKMRQFQLADPRAYVLELVEAAHLKGASHIAFQIDSDDMIMQFDGEPFTTRDFEHVWSSLFVRGDNKTLLARRELALGLNAAMALNPRWAKVSSGKACLTVLTGQKDEVSETDIAVQGTHIHVKDRFRPGLVVQFFKKVSGRLAEEVHLKERCRWAEIGITLDGLPISGGAKLKDAAGLVTVDTSGFRGVAGFVPGINDPTVHIVKDGVWITTHLLKKKLPGFCAIIEGDHLTKDVSGANIVENPAYNEMMEIIENAEKRSIAALCKALFADEVGAKINGDGDPEARKWALRTLRTALFVQKNLSAVLDDPNLECLARLPVWPQARGPDDRRIHLQQLIDLEKRAGQIDYSTKRQPLLDIEDDHPIPFIATKEGLEQLRKFLPEVRNATKRLDNQVKRVENRRRWEQRSMAPVLPKTRSYRARTSVVGDSISGEMGVSALSLEKSKLFLINCGCLLVEMDIQLPVRGLEIVLEGAFTPTARYDDARRDGTLAEALLQAASQLPVLAARLAQQSFGRDHPQLRRWVLETLHFCTRPNAAVTFLQCCGFKHDSAVNRAKSLEVTKQIAPRLGLHGATLATADSIDTHLEPLIRLPLFGTLHGGFLSHRDLQHEVEVGNNIRWVSDSLDGKVQLDFEPVLRLCTEQLQIIEHYFSSEKLESCQCEYDFSWYRSRHLEKPPQPLKLPHSGLRRMALSTAEGIEGEVRLPDSGDYLGRPLAKVRVLKFRRKVCEIEIERAYGFVDAVINYDQLTPTHDWAQIERDQHFALVRDLLDHAAKELVEKLCVGFDEISSLQLKYVRSMLIEVAARVLGNEVTPGVALPDPRAIKAAPLFRDMENRFVTLGEIERAHKEHGVILFIQDPKWPERLEGRLVLQIEDIELAALVRIFGPGSTEDAAPLLAEQRKQRALHARPEIEELKIAPGKSLVRVPFCSMGLEGEIGLSEILPYATVKLCRSRRLVGIHRFACTVPLIAVLDDPSIPVDLDGNLCTDSPRLKVIEAACAGHIPALICELADTWNNLNTTQKLWARHHLILFLAELAPSADGSGSIAQALRKADLIPCFEGADAKNYTLQQLRESQEIFGNVAYITSHFLGEPLDPRRIVLSMPGIEPGQLANIVRLLPYDVEWAEEQAGRKRRDAAVNVVRDVPAGVLVTREGRRKGVMTAMWLPAPPKENMQLSFAKDGKLIEKRSASDLFPCEGIVEGELEVARSWDKIALNTGELKWLEKRSFRLYASLSRKLRKSQLEGSSQRAAATVYLSRAVVALHRAISSGERQLEQDFLELYEELGKMALLQMEGRYVTLWSALEERPAALDSLYLWEPSNRSPGSGHGVNRDLADVDKAITPRPSVFFPSPSPSLVADSPSTRIEPTSSAVSFNSEMAPTTHLHASDSLREDIEAQSTKLVLSRDERFLAAVREELRWSRGRFKDRVDDSSLESLFLREGRSKVVATAKKEGVTLFYEHPVVDMALRNFERDSMWITLVASSVFSAINILWEAITDKDEMEYQTALLESTAARLASNPEHPRRESCASNLLHFV